MENETVILLSYFAFCMSFSYEALAQEERATPKSGEGISGFLQRNGRTGKAYYQEFLELNKKQLRGKEELRLGVKYLLPPLKRGVAIRLLHPIHLLQTLLLQILLPVPATKQFVNLFSEKVLLKLK